MNIPSLSSTSIASLSSVSGASAVSSPQDPDADGDGQMHVHHGGHHRGGAVGSAMMAALQSLGLSIPPPAAGGTSDSGSASTGQDSGSAGSVGHDVRQMMHALFEAVRGEQVGESGTTGSGSAATAGGPSSFATGLSALITQVANGSAPSDLQSAFSQLVQDAGATGTAGSANANLQAFLTQLQANLGYAADSGSGIGNLMATQA